MYGMYSVPITQYQISRYTQSEFRYGMCLTEKLISEHGVSCFKKKTCGSGRLSEARCLKPKMLCIWYMACIMTHTIIMILHLIHIAYCLLPVAYCNVRSTVRTVGTYAQPYVLARVPGPLVRVPGPTRPGSRVPPGAREWGWARGEAWAQE